MCSLRSVGLDASLWLLVTIEQRSLMKMDKYRIRRCIKTTFLTGHLLVQYFLCKVKIAADCLTKIFKRKQEGESLVITLYFSKTIVNVASRIMYGLLFIS